MLLTASALAVSTARYGGPPAKQREYVTTPPTITSCLAVSCREGLRLDKHTLQAHMQATLEEHCASAYARHVPALHALHRSGNPYVG